MSDNNTAILKQVLASRSAFYLMLARFYQRPLEEAEIEQMAGTDYTQFAEGDDALAEGFNDITRFLRKRNTGTRQTLATDFTMTFDGVGALEEKVAVPYASVFLSEEGLLSREPRNEVFRLYKKEALRLRQGVNLPEDHLSFELEFLSVLSDRAACALEDADSDAAASALKTSSEFITGHILTWFGLFSDLAGRMLETRFYRGVLKITEGYLKMDLQTIADLLDEIGAADD